MHSTTIRVYLAGINFITKLLTGSPHPFSSHPHVTLLLKGLKDKSLTALLAVKLSLPKS